MGIQATGCGKKVIKFDAHSVGHLDSQKRVIGGSTFHKECKGAGLKGSPPIHSFFKPTAQPTPGREQDDDTPDSAGTRATAPPARPTPKRLSTQLTECEDDAQPLSGSRGLTAPAW